MTNYNELLSAAKEIGWDKWKEYEQFFDNKERLNFAEGRVISICNHNAELYTMTNIQKWLLDVHGIWVLIKPYVGIETDDEDKIWFFELITKFEKEWRFLITGRQYAASPSDALREGLMEAIKTIK